MLLVLCPALLVVLHGPPSGAEARRSLACPLGGETKETLQQIGRFFPFPRLFSAEVLAAWLRPCGRALPLCVSARGLRRVPCVCGSVGTGGLFLPVRRDAGAFPTRSCVVVLFLFCWDAATCWHGGVGGFGVCCGPGGRLCYHQVITSSRGTSSRHRHHVITSSSHQSQSKSSSHHRRIGAFGAEFGGDEPVPGVASAYNSARPPALLALVSPHAGHAVAGV